MKTIYFITGNNHKFREAQAILPNLERIEIDLPEEQTLDPEVVIRKKLQMARQLHDGPLIVEDTSLYLTGLNGFPGPLIKWLLQAIGSGGIYELCRSIHNSAAIARTVIGYADETGVLIFEGEVSGEIVKPSGNHGFGWDAIFRPEGLSETFAEMGDAVKPAFSMRSRAFEKLKKNVPG